MEPLMIGTERLFPLLTNCGILPPGLAVLHDVLLAPTGRSHPVFRLEVDGTPQMAVKIFQPRVSETEGEAARERLVSALAWRLPALAALLPEMLAHSGPESIIVRRWFAGRPAWEADARSGGAGTAAGDLTALAIRIGPPLGQMHRATARLLQEGGMDPAFNAPLPWALRVFDGDSADEIWQNPHLLPLLRDAAARPALVAGIRRARGAWRTVSLIHGDLKHDNVLRGDDGTLAVIDWEMARTGDPVWDLAGLMVRPLLESGDDPQEWKEETVAAARALLTSYAGVAAPRMEPLAQRLVLYCGAWVLMSLIQYRSAAPTPDEASQQRLLHTAEFCFTQCNSLISRLCGENHAS